MRGAHKLQGMLPCHRLMTSLAQASETRV